MKKPTHIFCADLDQQTRNQFESAMAQPFVRKGALMPDAHKGYSLPIGAVIATQGVVLPSWVGYDIGCGICGIQTPYMAEQLAPHRKRIFEKIYDSIPVGFQHRDKDRNWDQKDRYDRSNFAQKLFEQDGLKQLCTLGGGNHFIEIGQDAAQRVWVLVHSGSRGFGHAVATHYMKLAPGTNKAKEGHFGFKVESKHGADYIKDMRFCLEFALENRRQMILCILSILGKSLGKMGKDLTGLINQSHNFVEQQNKLWVHRKGAILAGEGVMGVMGGNMKDGCFIVEGLGNEQSLCSSSHGAGRAMSRRQAIKSLSLNDFKSEMKNIVAKVGKSTLDEAPQAYKDLFEVQKRQKGLVKTLHHITPLINIKA